jgi:hypothetical protein
MSGGGGQQPVTQQTTQTKDPWGPAQPHLTGIMGSAAKMYGEGTGYQPYTGETQAPLNPWTELGLNQTLAQSLPDPANAASRNLALGMISNEGLSEGMRTALGQYGDIYGEASAENPFLQSILEANNRRIGDRINSSMSGAGRYGSGQHADVMARALAESANPILAADYEARQGRRMQATGAMADIYGGGLQRAAGWAGMAPSLWEQQFAPQEKLLGVGGFYDTRAQQGLADDIKLYNAQQAYPWEQLARYSALVGGAGGLGGTQITTQPVANQPSQLAKILGGASAGAGIGSMIMPGVGTGVGALGGGLLGLM